MARTDSGAPARPLPPNADFSAEEGYQRRLALVNAGLDAVLPPVGREPGRLHEAMRHAVFAGGGGKRLRPVILLTVAADLGVPEDQALPAALALELVHNYSLVHDDLPCMDDAPERRGAPSVHAAYGYTDAVLAGDALLTLAFEVLGRAGNSGLPRPGDLVVELAAAAGSVGMVGGQHADLDRSGTVAARLPAAGPDPVLKVHALKTGKLFTFAFVAPGYLAQGRSGGVRGGGPASGGSTPGAPYGPGLIDALRQAGESFGLGFQVADDIRDADEDSQAPNYAKAIGVAKARAYALEAVRRSLDGLKAVLGDAAQSPRLVAGAVKAMGL